MAETSRRGIVLAVLGALILTPDALFMRISGLDGFQMLGWRGLCMGVIFVTAWAVTSRDRTGDLARLGSAAGLVVIIGHVVNASCFPLGIAAAPVSVVLLSVATVPVWAALLARLIWGERAGRATWVTIAVVLAGLAYAVFEPGTSQSAGSAIGVLCGLAVALSLAVNFVVLRHRSDLPLLLVIGIGALCAGGLGWSVTGPERMTQGTLWAILLTATVILPLSFFLLSLASRHTAAANVSLLMLLETVLGPLWVWLGIGEAPTPRMLIGGAVVVGALAIYILRTAPRKSRPKAWPDRIQTL